MAEAAGIITAIATGTLALISVGRLFHSAISKKRRRNEIIRLERSPVERVEVVNVEPYSADVATILVRNRSHLPVGLHTPVFEIRGVRSRLAGGVIQKAKLRPGETEQFHMRFDGLALDDISPDECVLVDTGRMPSA